MSKFAPNRKSSKKSSKISNLERKVFFQRFCLILLIVSITVGLSITLYHLFGSASDEAFWLDVIFNKK